MKRQPWHFWVRLTLSARCCLFAFTMMIYTVYDGYTTGAFSLERTVKYSIKNNESCSSQVIDDNKGVGFIKYDCADTHPIMRALNRCRGRYIIFADRIDKEWFIDESSKQILWDN